MVLATCTGAVAFQDSEPPTDRDTSMTAAAHTQEAPRSTGDPVSRSAERTPLKKPANRADVQAPAKPARAEASAEKPEPVGHMFLTTDLNVRSGPGEDHSVVTVLEAGSRVPVTGTTQGPWAEIVYQEESRWVTAEYLSEDKPEPEPQPTPEDSASEDSGPTSAISEAACPSGSSVESGLTPDAIRVHRAVCAQFPEVDSYGGLREGDDDEHGQGRALDIMVSDSSLGDQIAEWVRANSQRLGASEVIWSQRIWTAERSSEGWRPMEDRGSTTANHYDHVHVTVYGDSGG